MLTCSASIVLDDQEPPAARLRKVLDLGHRRRNPLRRGRLDDEGKRAARQTVLSILVESHDLDRDMARQRICA